MISNVYGDYPERDLASGVYYIFAMFFSPKAAPSGALLDEITPESLRLLDEDEDDDAFFAALCELLAISARNGGEPIVALTVGSRIVH